jgi:hypothetical protein
MTPIVTPGSHAVAHHRVAHSRNLVLMSDTASAHWGAALRLIGARKEAAVSNKVTRSFNQPSECLADQEGVQGQNQPDDERQQGSGPSVIDRRPE